MAGRYLIRVRSEFCAAHVLHGYAGACNRVHGHNWTVEVEVECRQLDAVGMGVDFRVLRAAVGRIIEGLDHRMLNEIPPFDEVNPTAENVAAFLFHRLPRELPGLAAPGAKRQGEFASVPESGFGAKSEATLRSVTVAENDRSSVRYTED